MICAYYVLNWTLIICALINFVISIDTIVSIAFTLIVAFYGFGLHWPGSDMYASLNNKYDTCCVATPKEWKFDFDGCGVICLGSCSIVVHRANGFHFGLPSAHMRLFWVYFWIHTVYWLWLNLMGVDVHSSGMFVWLVVCFWFTVLWWRVRMYFEKFCARFSVLPSILHPYHLTMHF